LAIECVLKSTGVGKFGTKFGEEGLTDVRQILRLSGRALALSYAK